MRSPPPKSVVRTHDWFIQQCKKKQPEKYLEYEFLEEYNGTLNKIRVKHIECGREFLLTPAKFLNRGDGCSLCNRMKAAKLRSKTDDDMNSEIQKFNHEYELVRGTYIRDDRYMKVRHIVCGTEYTITPTVFHQKGTKCPICYKTKSEGELRIRELLTCNNINFVIEKTYDDLLSDSGRVLRFDFFIPEKNILIEFDGQLHYEIGRYSKNIEKSKKKLELTQNYDERKNKYCKDHNIILIRIPYWEFKNIEKILIENKIIEEK